jgi:hypothetical protein
VSEGWLATYADALGLGLDDGQVEALLDLARDVAHGTERMYAPLSAFLAGCFVGSGGSLTDAVERARCLLPEQ